MPVSNIFSPRKVFKKGKDGILIPVDYESPGVGDWDEYYIDREIIEYPVPVEGGSPDDYVLKTKIKETKRSIKDVIDSQADDVGLDNALRKFALTGDPSVLPSPVAPTDEIIDLTKLPEDSADYFTYIHGLANAYEHLPIDLRKDLSMEDFTKKVINGEIDVNAYLKSVKPVEVEKDGDK